MSASTPSPTATTATRPVFDSRFPVDERSGEVSARLVRPADAHALLVLAHGAGADMNHAFMESIARRLADRSLATFRFQFPYTEAGRRGPNPGPVLRATVRAALAAGAGAAPGLPLIAAGKSMGGRMTSLLAADEAIDARGIVFFGFPLHAAGKPPSTERGEHLARVGLPMLFLQGTRDKLADLALLEPLVAGLGAKTTLHRVEGGDHGFHVLKRSGRNDAEVLDELADTTRDFVETLL
ncbi:MAG: dienelactone hydrolase family protein [Deltaproteobacteria bacterium]|nr:dienelactone hydrolase family protein [Deltaproteobacteria bacterium]